jgi:RNA polymerase sigma-70 factor (ECF subfamily)
VNETEAPSFEQVVLPHLDAAYNLARWLVRAWLLQIVRNAAYAAVKSRRIGTDVPLETDDAMELPDPGPGPEAQLAQRQDLEQLDQALAALPMELRECLVLCELERLSYKDIARVTGAPIGTVMSRLWRARQALMRLQADGRLG